jgi:phosphatidylethanolamine/phosphatidyl-N-methylethanolamine N-methyltransferase
MSERKHPIPGRLPTADNWRFLRQWLRNPLTVAAVTPSSRQLARRMVSELPDDARRVIELGGGTGVFTRAILERGIAPADLMVLELNEELARLLRERFEGARVVCGDARELPQLAAQNGYLDDGPADAVISGLGLLSMARPTQREILRAAFDSMRPEGRMIQFTYGPVSPVPRSLLDDLELNVRRSAFAWWNMPPATVYVFTRRRSRGIAPVKVRPPRP